MQLKAVSVLKKTVRKMTRNSVDESKIIIRQKKTLGEKKLPGLLRPFIERDAGVDNNVPGG